MKTIQKIVLINPRLNTWSPTVYVPLGITTIAAVLELKGYDVELIDLNVGNIKSREFQKKISTADIVGITGMITSYRDVLKLVSKVKELNSKVPIVLGGSLATTVPKELLQSTSADFIVLGEGENTVIKLINTIEKGSNTNELNGIRGIAYRKDSEIIITPKVDLIQNLDTIPFPARHLLNMNLYFRPLDNWNIKTKEFGKIKSTNMMTSRGCPYNCTFCFKAMWGYKWRGRSPESMIQEIELLHKDYGANGFFFDEEVFGLNQKRVLDFCQLIRERGLKIIWHCNDRVNLVSKDLLKVMYDAGCRDIAYGIESGNQEILDSMRKKITLDQVRQAVKWTKEAGIHTTGYFILGMLGETKSTIEDTINFARELKLPLYAFSIATPYPGTELYNSALEKNFLLGGTENIKDHNVHTTTNLTLDCSSKNLEKYSRSTFREFYLKNRFGKYYFLNPRFLRASVRMLFSLQNYTQVKGFLLRTLRVLH